MTNTATAPALAPLIQLPNDAIATGYKLVSPYDWQQIFFSPSREFTGTEQEFLRAGFAYEYRQISKHARRVISRKNKTT